MRGEREKGDSERERGREGERERGSWREGERIYIVIIIL